MGKQYTTKDLARKYGLRRHQIVYALMEDGVEADQKVANVNIWRESSLPRIEAAVNRIATRQREALKGGL